MSASIAAVVVTYNRIQLLTECLDALLAQSRPLDRIILVDNASSDGTSNVLRDHGYLNHPIVDYILLEENTGGAGGFYEGMKFASNAHYDWLWLMDDDGLPQKDCLCALLDNTMKQSKFRSPLVIDIENNNLLSFGYQLKGKVYESVNELRNASQERVIPGAQPFNGCLIANSLVESIGYPKKEMFIWGDEVEYLARAKNHGAKPIVNLNAIFFHPRNRQKWEPVFGGILGKDLRSTKFKLYCFYRNHAYINLTYHGHIAVFSMALKLIIKKCVTGKFHELIFTLKAIRHGYLGQWGLEKEYM